MNVALLDLGALNAQFADELVEASARVVRSGRYILGPEVEAFEAEWAAYCGVEHCVGTANALEALQMLLMASGIGAGDEVIVPANTYIATWLAVTHAGATPVPVEPDALTMNLDPERIEAAITSRTRAIVAVHLYGLPADMDAISAIAAKHGLAVFEDAAQAHGAIYDKKKHTKAGALGTAAAFSFYPSKNLGALGDAGAVTTNSAGLAAQVRRMRNYGGVGRVDHRIVGINSRLDEMQAAVLRVKLKHLDVMNYKRRLNAITYFKRLKNAPLILPPQHYNGVFHQFVVRSACRDALQAELARRGVDTHVHYPVPPYREGAYSGRRWGSFPIADALAVTVLSLPIGNEIDVEAVALEVADAAMCVEAVAA